MPTAYLLLLAAVVGEVVATSLLKSSEGFTKPWPSLIVVVGYALAFWLLALTLKEIPVGIAYSLWSGLGVVLIAALGYFIHGQRLDVPALIGIGLILAGVVVVNLFSKSAAH